ncbi:hypothetical protein EC950183_3483, partial [Escherichia coli 95.0183]
MKVRDFIFIKVNVN